MVSFVKTLLYTNISIQRKCLKAMDTFVKNSEGFIDKKEAFLEDFLPKAKVSEEKIENLLHDVGYIIFSRGKKIVF